MPTQLSMFDLFREPPIRLAVDPDGHVIQDRIHTVLSLGHPRYAYERARIELHPHAALWMWATAYHLDGDCGQGHRVGPKWGKFAPDLETALYWATQELQTALAPRRKSRSKDAILKWLSTVEPAASAIHHHAID